MKQFNVLLWDFNSDKLTNYDVLPYLRSQYKERVKRSRRNKNKEEFSDYWKVPVTLDEFKKFVKKESQYQWWGRCEYEMICHGWPVRRNDHKLDVHEQVMININIIAEILYNEINNSSNR